MDLQNTPNIIWARNEKHSVEYARRVYERLAATSGKKAAVKKALRTIGEDLESGDFWK